MPIVNPRHPLVNAAKQGVKKHNFMELKTKIKKYFPGRANRVSARSDVADATDNSGDVLIVDPDQEAEEAAIKALKAEEHEQMVQRILACSREKELQAERRARLQARLKLEFLLHEKRIHKMLKGKYPFESDFLSRYKIKKLLGAGAFGVAVECKRQQSREDHTSLVACKIIRRDNLIFSQMNPDYKESDGSAYLKEIELLRECQSPYVISAYEEFIDAEFIIEAMELFGHNWSRKRGGCSRDLFGFLNAQKRIFETELDGCICPGGALQIIAQVALAIQYCHSRGIAHLDIKEDVRIINAECAY